MKKTIKTLATIMVAAFLPTIASAQYFMEGGLGYQVLSAEDHTVEVTGNETCTAYHGNIDIPATVTHDSITYDVVSLGYRAFYGASLTGITIPTSIIQIQEACFRDATGPTTINIPASVTYIGYFALAMKQTTTINVDESNPSYRSIDGILFSKDTSSLEVCPPGKSGTIAVPQNTRYISAVAFYNCKSVTSVTLPDGLLEIGVWAFVDANHLNNLVIPSTVSYIGNGLFGGCTALTNLSIAPGNSHYYMDGLTIYSTGGDTLVSCHKSADSLFLPATLRVVGGFLNNKSVKYVHVPESVTTIENNAFESSSLRSIDLPSHLERIGSYAFSDCSQLVRVGMPTTLDTMDRGAFELCTRLSSIIIPNGLRTIPFEAFMWCPSLSRITWGDAVSTIDSYAFGNCAFNKPKLPSTLRSIRYEAFWKGPKLNRVVFSAPVDTLGFGVFDEHSIGTLVLKNAILPFLATDSLDASYSFLSGTTVDTIIIPCGSLNAYLSDSYWGQFADKYHEDCNGIDDAGEVMFSVYPNPAYGDVTVHVGEPSVLSVIDITGREVIAPTEIQSTLSIPHSALSSGTYYLCLHTTCGMVTKKVIVF